MKRDQAGIQTIVEGEGVLSERRVVARGAEIEPALREFIRKRSDNLSAADGDAYRAKMVEILEFARDVVSNPSNGPIARNSVPDIAARLIAACEFAEACAARADTRGAMLHAAHSGDLARLLATAAEWNSDAIEGRKIRGPREEGQRRRAAAEKAAAARKYARLQAAAERLIVEKPALSNGRIAELAGRELGFEEKPDTLARRIAWPADRRRARKSSDGQLRRP